MRDIKFRGYCENIHEWVYGGLLHVTKDLFGIDVDDYYIVNENGVQFKIADIKSIGQYTGLKDKNGVEIYEGDIVKSYSNKYQVYYGKIRAGFVPFANDGGCGCCCDCETTSTNSSEVIGNIHDNPELLEEE